MFDEATWWSDEGVSPQNTQWRIETLNENMQSPMKNWKSLPSLPRGKFHFENPILPSYNDQGHYGWWYVCLGSYIRMGKTQRWEHSQNTTPDYDITLSYAPLFWEWPTLGPYLTQSLFLGFAFAHVFGFSRVLGGGVQLQRNTLWILYSSSNCI